MFDLFQHMAAFAVSSAIFAMAPGIDTVFVINRSLSGGRRAALAAALGINVGCMVHVLIGAFGLSAFLATSPEAMTAVKLAGAAYLLWLGIRAISSRAPVCGTLDVERSTASAFDAFRSGVIADVLNPKAALFVLSFFPQFLTQQAVGSPAAFITLGVLYTLISLAWYIPLALCVSSAGSRLLAKPAFNRWSGKATGLVFVLLGLQVAAG